MPDPAISGLTTTVVGVSEKTNWLFVELCVADGRRGLGEATLHGLEPVVRAWLGRAATELRGAPVSELPRRLEPGMATRAGLVGHAAISALEQARADIEAQGAGTPVSSRFGPPGTPRVELYANLNRSLTDRGPEAFAARAGEAVQAGYGILKIAPFDGVAPSPESDAENERRIARGLDRIRAVRKAVGPDTALLVDCHWRFAAARALRLPEELAEFGVGWLECPLPETPANFAALADLRVRTDRAGMALAGAETMIGLDGFAPFLDLYDVIMPDVKYCGGPFELSRIADAARERGVGVAPHNPSGPVAHAHSLHLAAHPGIDLLESQFRESPLFDRVIGGAPPEVVQGVARASEGAGVGVTLDAATCGAHPARPVPLLNG